MRATTMVEILVVLIIVSIVIGSAFSGVEIVKRLLSIQLSKQLDNIDMYSSRTQLMKIVEMADSAHKEYDNNILLFKHNKSFSELIHSDSFLIVDVLKVSDTLFNNVMDIQLIKGEGSDSVVVIMNNTRLIFNTKPQIYNKHLNEEAKYSYDNKKDIKQ